MQFSNGLNGGREKKIREKEGKFFFVSFLPD